LPQPAPPALLRQLSRSFERRRSVRRCSYPCTKMPVVLNLLSLCLSRACLGKRIVFGINMAPEKRATFAPPRELHVVIEGQRSLRQHVHVLLHVRCRGAAVVATQERGRELASIQRWVPAPRFKIQLIVLSGGYRSSQLIVLSEFVLHHIAPHHLRDDPIVVLCEVTAWTRVRRLVENPCEHKTILFRELS
jgi:hypothetical protein